MFSDRDTQGSSSDSCLLKRHVTQKASRQVGREMMYPDLSIHECESSILHYHEFSFRFQTIYRSWSTPSAGEAVVPYVCCYCGAAP